MKYDLEKIAENAAVHAIFIKESADGPVLPYKKMVIGGLGGAGIGATASILRDLIVSEPISARRAVIAALLGGGAGTAFPAAQAYWGHRPSMPESSGDRAARERAQRTERENIEDVEKATKFVAETPVLGDVASVVTGKTPEQIAREAEEVAAAKRKAQDDQKALTDLKKYIDYILSGDAPSELARGEGFGNIGERLRRAIPEVGGYQIGRRWRTGWGWPSSGDETKVEKLGPLGRYFQGRRAFNAARQSYINNPGSVIEELKNMTETTDEAIAAAQGLTRTNYVSPVTGVVYNLDELGKHVDTLRKHVDDAAKALAREKGTIEKAEELLANKLTFRTSGDFRHLPKSQQNIVIKEIADIRADIARQQSALKPFQDQLDEAQKLLNLRSGLQTKIELDLIARKVARTNPKMAEAIQELIAEIDANPNATRLSKRLTKKLRSLGVSNPYDYTPARIRVNRFPLVKLMGYALSGIALGKDVADIETDSRVAATLKDIGGSMRQGGFILSKPYKDIRNQVTADLMRLPENRDKEWQEVFDSPAAAAIADRRAQAAGINEKFVSALEGYREQINQVMSMPQHTITARFLRDFLGPATFTGETRLDENKQQVPVGNWFQRQLWGVLGGGTTIGDVVEQVADWKVTKFLSGERYQGKGSIDTRLKGDRDYRGF